MEKALHSQGRHTYILDGDNIRHGLKNDLGFTDEDRIENIRRIAEVAKIMADAGLIVLVSFISPFRAERELARALMVDGEFIEVCVDTPIEECVRRESKGLYKKAMRGGCATSPVLYQRALIATRLGFPNRLISDSLCQTEIWHDESDFVAWRL